MAWEHLLRPAAINQGRRMLSHNGGRLKTTLPDILNPFTLAGLLVIARQIARTQSGIMSACSSPGAGEGEGGELRMARAARRMRVYLRVVMKCHRTYSQVVN